MDPKPASRVWTFAGCMLDERSLELKVGGAVAHLDRKPLEVLLHLLRHAGEVVTKDELAEAVWPGRIITDSNLTKTVAVLRGALGEVGQAAIKTVHGYGYRLVAPVGVQMPAAEPGPSRIELKAGDSPPLRPQWRLDTQLGAGGQGEVWLARHAGTREARVFKFAEGGRALTALKREITLNRLLRETLPQRLDYLRLIDWNLDEPPCFVESEFVAGGSLAAWAESRGGLAAIALEQRLELLAQVAEAVAAAHSVGVLHKDLKPGNVLVAGAPGPPRIVLADFGSGGVVDPAAIDAYGITRMGFTQTVHTGKDTSGTPLYLAPEVIAGQPFTVQSDVYALGVMLYQLVAGDLRKALAPGWEKDVADELLREDIAAAAAGNPADRLGDAALLAQRLHALARRRHERAQEQSLRAQAERGRRMRGEVRRLRLVATVLLVAAGVAIAASVLTYRARAEAERAARTAAAVNEFLNHDLLASADPHRGPTRDLTVRKMLDRAAATVQERFAGEPAVAAQVHLTLGRAYRGIGEFDAARAQLERAATLFEAVDGPFSMDALDAGQRLANVLDNTGEPDRSCEISRGLMERFAVRLPPLDERLVNLRLKRIRCGTRGNAAAYEAAIPELAALVAELEKAGQQASQTYLEALEALSLAHFDTERYADAARAHRKVVASAEGLHGAAHVVTVRSRAILAGALSYSGRTDEADAELRRAYEDLARWSGEDAGDAEYLRIWEGLLRLEQGRFGDAERLARQCLTSPLGRQRRGSYRVSGLYLLGETLLHQGRHAEAIGALREVIEYAAQLGIERRHYETPSRAMWAEALVAQGRVAAADEVLREISEADAARLNRSSWRYARLRRAQGQLWLARGQAEAGRSALAESHDVYRTVFGPGHWRTQRAARELAALDRT